MRLLANIVSGVVLLTLIAGCNNVPDYVIPPDDMAEIMADMHIAETVVDNNYRDYMTDSSKMLLKQSVVARHGYTLADLDTSFMWYGANLTVYNEVYDKTIEILEDKSVSAGIEIQNMNAQTGDSFNIWNKPSFMIVNSSSPSKFLAYRFKDTGKTWARGDMFTLRAKFSNISGSPEWTMTVDYPDGEFEVLTNRFSSDGWHEITFFTDSDKVARQLYGSINFDVKNGTLIIDSLQLIQRSLDPKRYSQRYRQRTYDFSHKKAPKHEETLVE